LRSGAPAATEPLSPRRDLLRHRHVTDRTGRSGGCRAEDNGTLMPDVIDRYLEHWTDELESAFLYRVLASVAEGDQAGIYTELAEAEERHAAHWASRIQESGRALPSFRPRARARLVASL